MYALRLPRHACSPRDRARAGDLWRLVQEAAVHHSTDAGWPPSRYRETGTGFVVRKMTGVHLREAVYGEALVADTWVAETHRGVLMRRESEIHDVLRCSAEWVHVDTAGRPTRAPSALLDAFPSRPDAGPGAVMPVSTPTDPEPLPPLLLTPWWTEMDPMAHVNHPRYLDWAEECVCRWLAARGGDPVGIVPVAERLRFRTSATATDRVVVQGARVGRAGDAAAFELTIRTEAGLACEVTLLRAHVDGYSAFRAA